MFRHFFIMQFSPEVLLSNVAKNRCISMIKELPAFIDPDIQAKVGAAVLLPIFVKDNEVHILYTLRSSNLKSHSGQVSFPGGKIEENEGVVDAALRETEEEIGLSSDNIEVWCKMPPIQNRDKTMLITPVVGVVRDLDMDKLNLNIYEVDEIFSVSMSTFCDTTKHAHLKFEKMLLPVFMHERHMIWGITGYMTHFFLQCFLPSDLYKTDFTRKRYLLDELMPSKL